MEEGIPPEPLNPFLSERLMRSYTQVSLVGQPAALRRIDMGHMTDAQRMWQIEHSIGFAAVVDQDPQSNPKKFIRETRESSPRRDIYNPKIKTSDVTENLSDFISNCAKRDGIYYGIVKGLPDEFLKSSKPELDPEVGELQGWIYVYEAEREFLRDDEKRKLGILDPDVPTFEITYIKNPKVEKGTGLMESGIATALWDIARMNAKSDENANNDRTSPNSVVCASIDVDNRISKELAERLGFESIITIKGERREHDTHKNDYEIYTLNWDKFNRYLQQASYKPTLEGKKENVPNIPDNSVAAEGLEPPTDRM